MRTVVNPSTDTWNDLCKRPVKNQSELGDQIREILMRVRKDGDKALVQYSRQFDRAETDDLKITDDEISDSEKLIPDELKKAIAIAGSNIEKFHRSQLTVEKPVEIMNGVKCWRKSIPIERAGLYIPGGTAPLFSTVLMLAIPARIAGCRETILCTPPDSRGRVNPLILYSAGVSGVTSVFRVGGAQAIAAMAYGTETIPKTDKIFGPGNQYVTKAKEMVQLDGIPIDMPAGPSEVLIIADATAEPSFVASDLIAQAEHGTDSQVVLVSTSTRLIPEVRDEIGRQLIQLPRRAIAEKALENSILIFFDTLDKCIAFSNIYAPEHLIITVSDPASATEHIRNAGSVFLGKYSCESAGDYASGTNHTLPTNGFAKSYSGVSTESFMKRITFQEVTGEGIKTLGPVIEKMAEAEMLEGHKNAVTIRLNSLKNG
ncbi:MAG: histidinol dehydrogenase [Bacteroidales bacterium]|nr:histidinol dehydrogenase [Bacteroidales bacterium]